MARTPDRSKMPDVETAYMRKKRMKLEGLLKRCEIMETRNYYTLQIEVINIRLQELGLIVYQANGGKHKPTF